MLRVHWSHTSCVVSCNWARFIFNSISSTSKNKFKVIQFLSLHYCGLCSWPWPCRAFSCFFFLHLLSHATGLVSLLILFLPQSKTVQSSWPWPCRASSCFFFLHLLSHATGLVSLLILFLPQSKTVQK
ncbi:hypothetical protein K435DRAFT_522922 [Dendrothele bispora CBS 962.96]|uniref:Uncharacterized protein n=1 Tax=Dendrothele bispora (strain CBS 962.96) TaxID=1314807 RepID=A0A4S8M8M6_DENBC|nr:hypothetical protein K435DRAFT_522922 [Dendrothele bispora CBS 962.96]